MVFLNSTSNNDTFFLYPNMKQIDDICVTDDLKYKILLSGFLTIVLILSLVGNISTCAVIIRNRSMRTPTNCYLFNLAVTDLLTAVCIPVEIYIIWTPDYFPIGEIGCRIHYVIWDCLSNCSVLTIFAFTVERYIVIVKPFLRQSLVMTSRVIKVVIFNWLLSCLFCVLQVFNVFLYERDKGIYCLFQLTEKVLIVMSIDLFIFFAFPMTVIFVIYILIALKLKHTNENLKGSPANGKRNRDKAVTMLAAVAASFFFCWFPYSVLRLMMIIPRLRQDDYYKVWQVFGYLSLVNSYLSTAVNPILYSLMSRRFRQAFKVRMSL
ncbi:Neuropeptides capa receptor [Papilio xuthus]|uniref:Neuropeptides capa receptor n=1 Tax=Papilio xuthus TaxID=66420 RepID=A0A194PNI7_PAPXU|nr:Neuropeptides capa receptor [Papilio xuthus]